MNAYPPLRHLAMTLLLLAGAPAAAIDSVHVTPDLVMTGESSAFADGVWLRVSGQPGHANCFYAPANASLFYARPGGVADPNKALAMLMAAKLAGRAVSIEYANDGPRADFWGYGISSCEIRRLVLH